MHLCGRICNLLAKQDLTEPTGASLWPRSKSRLSGGSCYYEKVSCTGICLLL